MISSDPNDVATELEMRYTAAYLKMAAAKKIDYSKIKKCVNPDCEEPPVAGFRFCSRECRDEYELLLKQGRVKE